MSSLLFIKRESGRDFQVGRRLRNLEKGVKDSRIQRFKGLFFKDFINALSEGWLGVGH